MNKSNDNYFPYFDCLRIVLAIVVMLSHDHVVNWPHGRSGGLAVQVFFALSGWLIGGILLNLSRKDLPHFYFNRLIRIWIPYYLALVLLLAASLLRDPIDAKWIEISFYKALFVYNMFGTRQLAQHVKEMPLDGTGSHFWSVNAEEQFYLIAPLLLVLLCSKTGRSILLWIALAVFAWFTGIYASIVLGVLAVILVRRYGPFQYKSGVRYVLFGIVALSSVGMTLDWRYDLLSPFFAVSIVLLLSVKGPQKPIGKFIGGISYPLYLNHWIGVFIANELFEPFNLRESVIRKVISVILNLGIAAFLYWQVDRRMLALRPYIFSKSRGVAATITAYGLMSLGMVLSIFLCEIISCHF